MSTYLKGLIPCLQVLAFAGAVSASDGRLFLLTTKGGEIAVKRLRTPEGETTEIRCGADSRVIGLIYPPALGGSASLAQGNHPRLMRARNESGRIQLTESTATP